MQLVLSGKNHFRVTDSLRYYTEDKFKRIKRHFDHVINVNITFYIEKLDHIVTANLLIAGTTIQAHASSQESMHDAINNLVDKLDGQIKKHRGKQTIHHRDE